MIPSGAAPSAGADAGAGGLPSSPVGSELVAVALVPPPPVLTGDEVSALDARAVLSTSTRRGSADVGSPSNAPISSSAASHKWTPHAVIVAAPTQEALEGGNRRATAAPLSPARRISSRGSRLSDEPSIRSRSSSRRGSDDPSLGHSAGEELSGKRDRGLRGAGSKKGLGGTIGRLISPVVPRKLPRFRRQRTDLRVRTMQIAGGALVADALVQRSILGPPLKAMQELLRALPDGGAANAARLKMLIQKASLCVGAGRLDSAKVHEALGGLPDACCRAFLATESRVEKARTNKRLYRAYLDFMGTMGSLRSGLTAGLRTPTSRSPKPPPGTPNSSSRGGEPVIDPTDKAHTALGASIRQLGEAGARMLSPYLSVKTIGELDELIHFICRPDTLDHFFSMESVTEQRDVVLNHIRSSVDG
jgi:hypothetical protein